MKPTGIVRRVDHLGRIVVPVEFRRILGIGDGDSVEITLDDDRIVLQKLQETCTFCGTSTGLRTHRSKAVCSACLAELAGR